MGIVAEVSQLLGDPQSISWPKAHVYDAVNAALLWTWMKVRHDRVSAPVIIPAGATRFHWPDDVIMIPEYLQDADQQFFPTSLQEVTRYLRQYWNEGSGYPKHFIVWDYNHLRPFPVADQTYIYTMWGLSYPPEVSAANESPVMNHKLEHASMFKAGSLLIEDIQPDTADLWEIKAEAELVEYRADRRNEGMTNRRFKLTPAVRIQKAHIGEISVGRKF